MPKSDTSHPPGVERLLAAVRPRLTGEHDPAALVELAQELIAEERARIAAGIPGQGVEELAVELVGRLERLADPLGSGLVRVINATGVLLHTNLGRAPWPAVALEAARAAAAGYPLLELDRATGRRGARFRAAEAHLIALTGAADALVANNNAAALALAVGLVGRGGRIAVSSGELVEIGGGVRIPEIIRRSGARLVEVGTTNRTRAGDFEEVLADGRVGAVLRVHPSNFVIAGFTEAPDPKAVAELAHRHGAIVIDDLGSGALLPTEQFGLAHEPTPAERLAAGADLVTFSGDKLVGGPQAGLIVGRADLIARLRRDPLARATRPDKATMAAVAATLGLYRAGLAATEIPALADDRRRSDRPARPGGGNSGPAAGWAGGAGRRREHGVDRRRGLPSGRDPGLVRTRDPGAIGRPLADGAASRRAVRGGPDQRAGRCARPANRRTCR